MYDSFFNSFFFGNGYLATILFLSTLNVVFSTKVNWTPAVQFLSVSGMS